jgi:signal transduction histidine kinase
MERILARSIAVMCLVFGAQAIPFALMQVPITVPLWSWATIVLLYGGLIATAGLGLLGRGAGLVGRLVPIVYLGALMTWPLAVRSQDALGHDTPWLWYVCNLVLAVAAVVYSLSVATALLVAVPAIYALIRTTVVGGGVSPADATLGSLYVLLLGGGVLILVTLLRRAATEVDDAQTAAVERYATAVREHATEVERLQVDSIVHDSVLTSLLSAWRAETPRQRALATVMATNTMAQLDESLGQAPSAGPATLASLRERLLLVAEQMDVELRYDPGSLPATEIPVDAAESIHSATVQALVNSFQHAGGPDLPRWIAIYARPGGILVEVGDEGSGFDLDTMTEGRLGVRVSIQARLGNAGGAADVQSSPGLGTVISLAWPA